MRCTRCGHPFYGADLDADCPYCGWAEPQPEEAPESGPTPQDIAEYESHFDVEPID